MLTLRSVSGGTDIPVDHRLVLVGRHPQCDARLTSNWVSLRHCILTEDGGEVVVRDLGSTNGTWINGWRVEKGRLKLGDELSIAHIRYRLEGAPAFAATAAIDRDRPGP
jgi:pSer/pThr/pTyr-binding forkhead associated (FHA) protein